MQQCCFSDRCVICLTDRLWGAQWDLRCMVSSHCYIVASASPPWMVWRMTSRLAHTSCLGRMNLIIYYAEHQHPTTGGLTLVSCHSPLQTLRFHVVGMYADESVGSRQVRRRNFSSATRFTWHGQVIHTCMASDELQNCLLYIR